MEIVLVLMVVFSVAVVAWLALAQSGEPPARGGLAPEFRLADLEGVEHALSGLRGRRLVIVFHPQDNTPECVAVVESLSARATEIAGTGAWLATVVVSEPGAAATYARQHAAGLRVLCDPKGRVAKAYGALVNLGFLKFARKLVVLIDAEGKVEGSWRDAVGPQQVDNLVRLLTAAPPPSA